MSITRRKSVSLFTSMALALSLVVIAPAVAWADEINIDDSWGGRQSHLMPKTPYLMLRMAWTMVEKRPGPL